VTVITATSDLGSDVERWCDVPARAAAALFASGTRVSLLCEPDGTVLWASPSARMLLGLDPVALVGTRLGPGRTDAEPRLVLGGDGRPRRIHEERTDLSTDPAVGGVLVEWFVAPEPTAETDAATGLLSAAGFGRAMVRLAAAGERGIGVLRLRADRPLPPDVLALVGDRLRHALRPSDVAGRLADGDIVAVSSGHWTPGSAAGMAQRVRSRVNGPVRSTAGIVAIRLVAGVATGTTADWEALVGRAAHDLPGPGPTAPRQPAGSSTSG
jgi:hypothetical protein